MQIDWTFLSWLGPLAVGAALTFGFGWLDSTLKYRRDAAVARSARMDEIADKKRQDAREHAMTALEIASRIRDEVSKQKHKPGEPIHPTYPYTAASWNEDEVRRLRDVGILIPDSTVRDVISDATNFITASPLVSDGTGWELTPRDVQLQAMIKLREVLGAYLRLEPLDAELVEWFRHHAEVLESEWREVVAQQRAEMEALKELASED